ncbi:efflux RND transporter permease subunit [Mesorhizobium sp. 1M-11]|uniref:efflux RND transporter permease subunit n=1 Tax=Mesorhizobium sp. 1M-11 TaxID=1529006 RepID=UPI00244ED359|nr:efflux RND transporter permease subunit [Mesorhizobium sp. 1M-11]
MASPKKLWPDDSFCTHVRDLAQHSGGRFRLDEDLASCVEGADFIYTDVWLSMGEDKAGWADRIGLLTPYRVTKDVMASSGNPHVKFMHCLPAFHDTDTEVGAYIAREYGIDCMEVSDEVFESDASIVFDQAEILGIYILVVAQFGSFKLPLVILTPIPLTLIGIMLGHWAFGAPFSATSMIGFIALAGIIVRNSILLVDFIRHTQGTDRPLVEVLLEAGAIRFKPILLTALAAMIGAAVILTDPIFQGLAISLLFGLASSTLLTVLVIPAIYVALRSRRPVEIQPTLTDPDL